MKTHIGCNFDDNKIDYTKKRYLLHKKYEYKSKINTKNLQHIINKKGQDNNISESKYCWFII